MFAAAAMAIALLSPGTASAVQDGRFLEGGILEAEYSCTGADDITNNILTSFGLNPFPMPVDIFIGSTAPSPSPGEDFDLTTNAWVFTLDPGLVSFAVGLGVTSLTLNDGELNLTASEGATGTLVGNPPSTEVPLGDGTVEVVYQQGPFTGTFNRTAAVDSPITFVPGDLTTGVVTSSGTALAISCSPTAGALTVNDQTGDPPDDPTPPPPPVVNDPPAPPSDGPGGADGGDVGPQELPRTGSTSNLYLVLLALALIDVGYLALSAGRSTRLRRIPSAS